MSRARLMSSDFLAFLAFLLKAFNIYYLNCYSSSWMGSKLHVYEPRIDPTTKKMDVGGLFIPPTNTLTALLYGFANHELPKAREYYFWRLCDELWNHSDLPEPK